jgi:hypothetical protein
MNFLIPARAGAQLVSLVVFGLSALWYVAPWLNSRPRADAVIALGTRLPLPRAPSVFRPAWRLPDLRPSGARAAPLPSSNK